MHAIVILWHGNGMPYHWGDVPQKPFTWCQGTKASHLPTLQSQLYCTTAGTESPPFRVAAAHGQIHILSAKNKTIPAATLHYKEGSSASSGLVLLMVTFTF